MSKIKYITLWLLPVIVIGGLFYPLLGYLVLGMMVFFLSLSLFAGRFWCWCLCPRGAFLGIVVPKFCVNLPVPRIFLNKYFRYFVFIVLISIFIFNLTIAAGSFVAFGAVFIGMCVATTILSLVMGITTKPRSYCLICPMGTAQETLSKCSPFRGTRKNLSNKNQ